MTQQSTSPADTTRAEKDTRTYAKGRRDGLAEAAYIIRNQVKPDEGSLERGAVNRALASVARAVYRARKKPTP